MSISTVHTSTSSFKKVRKHAGTQLVAQKNKHVRLVVTGSCPATGAAITGPHFMGIRSCRPPNRQTHASIVQSSSIAGTLERISRPSTSGTSTPHRHPSRATLALHRVHVAHAPRHPVQTLLNSHQPRQHPSQHRVHLSPSRTKDAPLQL